jgi:ribosomal protein S11
MTLTRHRPLPPAQRAFDFRTSGKTVITLTDLQWAGHGWRTIGDVLLALSAAVLTASAAMLATARTAASSARKP